MCIQQTALELVGRGIEVHIVADATSSRSMMDRMFALEVIVLLQNKSYQVFQINLKSIEYLTTMKGLPLKFQCGLMIPDLISRVPTVHDCPLRSHHCVLFYIFSLLKP